MDGPNPSTARFRSRRARWRAVDARDPEADGWFVYSVRTTGVFCQPSCPSRAAKRENVGFHDNAAAAEACGFRPCRRCLPGGRPVGEVQAEWVARACQALAGADEPLTLDELAGLAGVSRFHFQRVFKSVTGTTPKAYASELRAARARDRLASGSSVTTAIYGAGFNSNSRFYEHSKKMLGMAPQSYLNGGEGERIRFAVTSSELGPVLVAMSGTGLCAILMDDDPVFLREELGRRFPKADLHEADSGLEAAIAAVVACIEEPARSLGLPLDLRGTLFQQRVWKALQEIPAGQTASYADVASRIGQPKAVRAVAGACGANPVAVVVPCHRVLRSDGAISGYRWGVERKRSLLAKEGHP